MNMKKTMLAMLGGVLVSATAGAADVIVCEGEYDGHLQGVATDGTSIYWSHTKTVVKTDLAGKVLCKVRAPRHQGDLCFHDGTVYVAVNLGKFNTHADGDSWVFAYDAETLEFTGVSTAAEIYACRAADGVVTFCYVSSSAIAAETPVAELHFRVCGSGSEDLTVTHLEADEDCFETEESACAVLHRYLAVYDAAGRMLHYAVLEQPFCEEMKTALQAQYPTAARIRLFSLNGDLISHRESVCIDLG